ncbi:MAG: hypothetical protein JWO72_166 [Caulobacteraceae bacterium]|jgi:hypothetical protein|nr:hypothetical protein [Caulobacteraceae bacterium]
MKFLRIGFVAALALALSGQAFAAAPAAPKIDPKMHDQGMKEAPAVLQAAGVDCTVSNAVFMGNGEATVGGKKVKSSIYEAACGGGLGYIVIATPGADTQSYDCLTMKEDSDKKVAAKQKAGTTCSLPENADPKQGLAPLLAKGGANCPQVTAAHWMGASPTDKVSLFEAACSNGSGYVLTTPLPGSTKPLSAVDCIKASGMGVECTLTSKEQLEQGIIKVAAGANKPACMPNKARWVVTDPATNNDYYEVGCADGTSGFMFQTDGKGAFKTVIECVRASRIAGGCTFSQADAGQTAEAATYNKLAKQVGYNCDVAKYQSYGAESGGQREIVELACKDHPEGAFAIVPTGGGQTGEYFNCVRAIGRGLTCHLTPMPATYAMISKEIAARGKTTCDVNNGRGIGKDAKGSEYIEVTCASGPGLVLEYSRLPTETLVSALPCAQAAIADACKLQKK